MPQKITAPSLQFDHAVIVSSDLDQTIEDFQSLGFHVEPGGFNGPTKNALIMFSDGCYIELISPKSKLAGLLLEFICRTKVFALLARVTDSISPRLINWFNGSTGLVDWCLRCEDLETIKLALESEGIECTSSKSFQRQRPDGKIAKWKLLAARDRSLPFFIQDTSQRQLRIPYEGHCEHANGVTGISAALIQSSDERDFAKLESIAGFSAKLPRLHIYSLSTLQPEGHSTITLELLSTTHSAKTLPTSKTTGAQINLVNK